MPFQVGPAELIVVLVVALIVLGPKRLPEVGRSLGNGIRGFKDSISGEEHASDSTPLDAGGHTKQSPGSTAPAYEESVTREPNRR